MPRQRSAQPAYQFHVFGQARVTLGGVDFYLGLRGTTESYARYYALLAEYNENGRQPPNQPTKLVDALIRVRDVTADFRARELPMYEGNNGQYTRFSNLCYQLDRRHGDEPANEFGPRKLEAMRDGFLAKGNSRKYANCLTILVVRIFKHGVSRELVAPNRIVALEALNPLKPGQGREIKPKGKVDLLVVKQTLAHLSPTLAAMVRIQVATAMRPSEIFAMRPCDIDRSGSVWD